MASKKSMQTVGALVILVVLALVALPYLRDMFAPEFPEAFRDLDCQGVTCAEGEFCQDNACHSVTAPVSGGYEDDEE